ncbi:hypothetical protein OO015_11650 [Thermomicrobium sp. 4228-Ro]|uniref:hypothetical protein n=1 Tax=Thermomicrobium sp. 4228-Ro TaxID=2993937 RepID=UPI002248CBEE|nr:hypothetical protein [Thermomicrobium sp. 4228-Ro]MCX2728144.1 hypothetical protein [Thermomicrobium sp. 4228-Ro]
MHSHSPPPHSEPIQLSEALATAAGRRWLRRTVLPALPASEAALLAAALLAYRDDFLSWRRDRSTWTVIERLDREALLANVDWLAGSNAALALWARLMEEGTATLVTAALRVLRQGTRIARETALTLLLADPTRERELPAGAERALLAIALADPDDVIRGLAVEIAAQRVPDLVLPHWRRWVLDASRRARRATWRSVLRADPLAREQALALMYNERLPADVRSDALWALAQVMTTAEIAPLLAAAVVDSARELAEVAADLLWTQHRHPLPAQAALESPHPAVRRVGEHLLDPRRGSPAAGGARPGMPIPLVAW